MQVEASFGIKALSGDEGVDLPDMALLLRMKRADLTEEERKTENDISGKHIGDS